MKPDHPSFAEADKPLRLLLVEDSDADAKLLIARLQKAGIGFQVQRAESEESLLRALEEPVDLIISDFTLMQFGAARVLDILKSRHLDIPLIVISGTINEESAVMALQGLEIARMRIRLRTKRKDLIIARSDLEGMAIQLVDAQETERINLARELHDEMGQRLVSLGINLHRLRGWVENADGLALLSDAEGAVAALIAQIRAISVSLRPPALDYLGLEAAIRQLLVRQFENLDISCTFLCSDLPAKLAPSIEITLYRVIQEGSTNIIRHAHATNVAVEIVGGQFAGGLTLTVCDDGNGFSNIEAALPADSVGSGLRGMRERIELLGGAFSIDTSPRGTCLTASLGTRR